MRVLVEFHDMYNMEIIYRVGDDFSCDDKDRINNLIKLGYIEGEVLPSIDSTIDVNTTKIKQTTKKTTKTKNRE